MEKYVKLQDVYGLLTKMHKEPRYQHDGEDYYSGVSQVAGEIVGLPTILIDVLATAKPEEPVQAQWKTREAQNDYLWVECSNCGYRVENYKAVETGRSSTDIVGYRWHACPKCTAKMIMRNKDE